MTISRNNTKDRHDILNIIDEIKKDYPEVAKSLLNIATRLESNNMKLASLKETVEKILEELK